MTPGQVLRRLAARPAWATAVVAAVLRTALVLHAWATNPLVRTPELDAGYYLKWAAEIAAGDLDGTRAGGLVSGEPWFLNSLYAYVIAPIVGLAADSRLGTLGPEQMQAQGLRVVALAGSAPLAIALAQAILGAATAALAAAAASRWSGRAAGWTAGLLVACAAPLAQLDAHVAVAELAAFLVAGVCFACAPATGGDRRAAHGPVAAGLWLGIGALARPIVPLALPFVAWRFARGTQHRARTVALVAVVFFACAVPSLARNWEVSGEPALYTAAGGLNVHLGNNAEARATRSMTSPHIRFNPIEMHEDARRFVHEALGRQPTRGEVGSWFLGRTVDECVRHPGASAAFYAHKARWFFGPDEIPSSASFAVDVGFSPWLRLAFVPAWLIAAAAVAGLWAARRRADVLLGPGAVVGAHWAVLTLVFPLSHYRAPAIPAMAVLAGIGVAAAIDAWIAGRRGAVAALVAIAGGTAVVGALPPGPDPLWMRDQAILAMHARDVGDLPAAERHAHAALDAYRRQWGRDSGLAWEMIGEMRMHAGRWGEALEAFDRSLELSPEEPFVRLWRSRVHEMMGNYDAAERDASDVVRKYDFLGAGWARLAAILAYLPARLDEGRAAAERAIDLGFMPDPAALARLGLRR